MNEIYAMIIREDIDITRNRRGDRNSSEEVLGAAEPDMFGNPEYITGTAAMNKLRFSRHTFEKCVGGGMIPQIILANKTVYDKADIDRFMIQPNTRPSLMVMWMNAIP